MHRCLVPSKDAAHRLACLSLYRTLLKQCTKFPSQAAASSNKSSKSPSSTLQALVRYRFKQDRRTNNWSQIRNALQFGRGALHLLGEASVGSPNALKEMARIISHSTALAAQKTQALDEIRLEQSQRELPQKLAKRKVVQLRLATKSNYRRQPETVPVLQRPLPLEQATKDKDGRRRVPAYFVAQSVPFLRYSRPQPLALGRFITNENEKLERFWNEGKKTQEMTQMGEMEDEWDTQLWTDHKVEESDPNKTRVNSATTWADVYRATAKEFSHRSRVIYQKQMDYGEKLWEVYLKEQALAKAENAARRQEDGIGRKSGKSRPLETK